MRTKHAPQHWTMQWVKARCSQLDQDAEPILRLVDWLVQQGGLVSGVELRHRSILTTERVEPGRLLISVPRTCQVSMAAGTSCLTMVDAEPSTLSPDFA